MVYRDEVMMELIYRADVGGDAFMISGQKKQTAVIEWTIWKQWSLNHKDFDALKAEKIDKMELLKSVDEILQKPELFSNALFQLRADDLINSKGPLIYKSRLSGYLLAIELLGSVEFWKNSDIVLIGNPDLIEMYQFILNKKVKSIKTFLSSDMVLKGLKNFKNEFQ